MEKVGEAIKAEFGSCPENFGALTIKALAQHFEKLNVASEIGAKTLEWLHLAFSDEQGNGGKDLYDAAYAELRREGEEGARRAMLRAAVQLEMLDSESHEARVRFVQSTTDEPGVSTAAMRVQAVLALTLPLYATEAYAAWVRKSAPRR